MSADEIGRRKLLKVGFWSLVGATLVGAGAAAARFLYPTGTEDDLTFRVSPAEVPEPGGPPFLHNEGKFFLVNLLPDEVSGDEYDVDRLDAGPGGIVALSTRCTHLHCSVVFDPPSTDGWRKMPNGFACPCHGATFSKAGSRRFGPAPRGLATAHCLVSSDGFVTVDMAKLDDGSQDNGQRAIQYPH